MKCQKHNCEMQTVGRTGFGQEGQPECPKCREEIEALRPKLQATEHRPPENRGRRPSGW